MERRRPNYTDFTLDAASSCGLSYSNALQLSREVIGEIECFDAERKAVQLLSGTKWAAWSRAALHVIAFTKDQAGGRLSGESDLIACARSRLLSDATTIPDAGNSSAP